MTDRLVAKLAQMAVRRELMQRRLSLVEALEIRADLAEAPDNAERVRWVEFVDTAHARGDFRYTLELTREEWSAVRFGRQVPVWSIPEIQAAHARVPGSRTLQATKDPLFETVRAMTYAAHNEERVLVGGTAIAQPIPFRKRDNPLVDEDAADVEREVDNKLQLATNVVEINQMIDKALARVEAKLDGGERVMPDANTLALLQDTINTLRRTGHGAHFPLRWTDNEFPRFNELLRAYTDVWSKAGNGPNIADEWMRLLEDQWNEDDTEAGKLAEKITGSPEPLPAELLAVERGLNSTLYVPR